MRKHLWLLALLPLLLLAECTRRYGYTYVCYVNLRYDSHEIRSPRSEIWAECKERHLWHPLYF